MSEHSSPRAAQTAQNKANLIRMYDETHRGNIQVLRDLLADDFVSYGGAGFQDLHGPEAFIDLYRTFVSAFPDLHFEVTHVVAEDDLVSVRGIQTGNFLGMVSPTNKKVTWTGTAIFRFNREGKIVERWQDLDNLALFIQLGVIPPIGQQPGGWRAHSRSYRLEITGRGKRKWQDSRQSNKTR